MCRKAFWVAACALAVFWMTPLFSAGTRSHKEKIIHSFMGTADGIGPSDLTIDAEGNLYGTTFLGGEPSCVYFGSSWQGCGTVFKLSPSKNGWEAQILYRFNQNSDNKGGALPAAGVTLDSNGNIYGTTAGNPDDCGQGNVYELTPESNGHWKETVLYTFTCDTGYNPNSDLVFDSKGDLFGTTTNGVFELIPQSDGKWKEVTLHQFTDALDGYDTASGIILDSQGSIYGTTTYGGGARCLTYRMIYGCGVVYKLTPNSDGSWKETLIYQFARGAGAAVNPSNGFVAEKAGGFLGSTRAGGDGIGTIFELIPSKTGFVQNILHRFYDDPDGRFPEGQLTVDSAGHVLGVTSTGGNAGYGMVFELGNTSKDGWRETILHSFRGGTDGSYPYEGVVLDSQGNIYGTTGAGGNGSACGSSGCGTVYEIEPD